VEHQHTNGCPSRSRGGAEDWSVQDPIDRASRTRIHPDWRPAKEGRAEIWPEYPLHPELCRLRLDGSDHEKEGPIGRPLQQRLELARDHSVVGSGARAVKQECEQQFREGSSLTRLPQPEGGQESQTPPCHRVPRPLRPLRIAQSPLTNWVSHWNGLPHMLR
jgi:hypothetical protein